MSKSLLSVVPFETGLASRKCTGKGDGVNLRGLLASDYRVAEFDLWSYTGMKQPELENVK